MPSATQAKLLRVLDAGEFRPVGSTRAVRVNFRILVATSGDLDRLVLAGRFRADLQHRVGALRIHVPPLRRRREDIPLLAEEFLARYGKRAGGGAPLSISEHALELLSDEPWPGNVRQLRNVVEAAAALAGEAPIHPGAAGYWHTHPIPPELGGVQRPSRRDSIATVTVMRSTNIIIARDSIFVMSPNGSVTACGR